MSLNTTPSAERLHIGIFGKRNAGKSSLINAITGQNIAIVSAYKGTTTDPVQKAMELLPLGPVMFIDTPGIDDSGELGEKRVQKTYQALNKTDVALLVADAGQGLAEEDIILLKKIQEKHIPCLIIYNKSDLYSVHCKPLNEKNVSEIYVSAKNNTGIQTLKETLGKLAPQNRQQCLLSDLLHPQDLVILVVPIDSAAPKGRIILPQQQTLRDCLDSKAIILTVQVPQLAIALKTLNVKPRLVITDSQVFSEVAKIVPQDIELTSFSILMARYKGSLAYSVASVKKLDNLKNGDKILISEGCTHHRQCDDIGTVKLPGWIQSYTKIQPDFVFSSGGEFPSDLSPYKLIVHCGGCMLNEREMQYRTSCARRQNVPMTNYGIAIAYMNGILQRSIAPLPEISGLLK